VAALLSGQLDGFAYHPIPVSGFVDDHGLVKLSFFLPTVITDWNFSGRLTARGFLGDISGNWTRMMWSDGWFLHHLGTLRVKKPVRRFDRAYLVSWGPEF
jgi:hypothetical protein